MSPAGPTLRAVAARAGVAPSTASLILRGEGRFAVDTVDRVLETAHVMGYAGGVARRLSPGTTDVAGVVSYNSISGNLREGHSQDVIRGLHRELATHSVALMLLPPMDAHGFDDVLERMPLDIVFLLSSSQDTSAVRAGAAARGIAVAHLESGGPHAPPPMISVDDLPPMRDLARHLVDLGHRTVATVTLRFSTLTRIGLVAPGPLEEIENRITRDRLRGLHEGGITPEYVYETGHSNMEEGAEAARLLMRLAPRPTAIVCHTDVLAQGVIVGLRELGLRVPEDVSVTGYDNSTIPSLAPGRLTSVHQDGVLKGTMLARIGIDLRAGKQPAPMALETFFIPGTTTGPPPAPPPGPSVG